MSNSPEPRDLEAGLERAASLAATQDPIARVDALRLIEQLLEGSEATDPASTTEAWRLRALRARLLEDLMYEDQALTQYSGVVDHCGNDGVAAEALHARGRMLDGQGHHEEAMADLALMEERYAVSDDRVVRRHVAGLRDVLLSRQAQDAVDASTQACWLVVVQAAQRIVVNHGDSSDAEVQVCVARALLWEARSRRQLVHLGDDSTAEASRPLAPKAADELFRRFSASGDTTIRAIVAESEAENENSVADPGTTLELTERMVGLRKRWGTEPAVFFTLTALHRAWALRELGEFLQSRDELVAMIADFRTHERLEVGTNVALGWLNLVNLLHALDDADDALVEVSAFERWLTGRPQVAAHPTSRIALSAALEAKISILQDRLPAFTDASAGLNGARPPHEPAPVDSHDLSASESTYLEAVTDLVNRFAADPVNELRAAAASALHSLAVDLRNRNHLEEAEEYYRLLIELFAEDPEDSIRHEHVAPGQLNLGFLLYVLLGRTREAIDVYDKALASFGHATSPHLRDIASKMHASRSSAVTSLADSGLSLGALEGDHLSVEAREDLRRRIGEGNTLTDAGKFAEAAEAYQAVISDFPQPAGPDLRMRICDATVRLGYCLNKLGRLLDSVDHHRRFLDEFGGDLDMTIEKDLALGMGNLASSFDRLGRHVEEIDTYARMLERWSHSSVPYIVEQCAKASWRKGVTEEEMGRLEDAEKSYIAGSLLLRNPSVEIRALAAISAVNLSVLLRKVGYPAEAIAYANEVLDALKGVASKRAREQFGKAQLAVARAHVAHGNKQAAVVAYEDILFEGASSPLTPKLLQRVLQEYRELDANPLGAAWRRLRRGKSRS